MDWAIDRIPQFPRTIQLGDQVIDRVVDRVVDPIVDLHSRSAGACAGASSFCNGSFRCAFGTNNTPCHTKHHCQLATALLLCARGHGILMHIDSSESPH